MQIRGHNSSRLLGPDCQTRGVSKGGNDLDTVEVYHKKDVIVTFARLYIARREIKATINTAISQLGHREIRELLIYLLGLRCSQAEGIREEEEDEEG